MKDLIYRVWRWLVHKYKMIDSPSYRTAFWGRQMSEAFEKGFREQEFKTIQSETKLVAIDYFLLARANAKRARKRTRNLQLSGIR